MSRLRVGLRLSRVMLHLLRGLVLCALVFPRISAGRRQDHVQRWSAQLLGILRIDLEVLDADARFGAAPAHAQRRVIVSNHVSWVDIFVINAMQPCRFVAKSDIRDWPLLGYLCASAETIFISRGSRRDVRRIFKNLVMSIEAGEQVAFFPEGTTAAQGTLLPFHANLFEAAIDAAVPIQPLALRYLDPQGALEAAVDYIGDTSFAESMLTILGGPAIRAQILVLPTIPSDAGDRRTLARATHASIGAALAQADLPGA